MLVSVLFVPSAPLLVPELSGPAAHDAEPIRAAALAASSELAAEARRWVAIGAADSVETLGTPTTTVGTFAAYGVDVPVSLVGTTDDEEVGEQARSDGLPATRLPLSMSIAGWLRAQAGAVEVTPIVVSGSADPSECADRGRGLRERLDAEPDRIGVLVVGDGAISLTAKAPGGGVRESGIALQARIDRALREADLAALADLGVGECDAEGVGGRAAWQVAAALCAPGPITSELLYAAAPFGVGYTVARWRTAGAV